MEDLLAQIEAPLLDNVNIKFFNKLTFDIPQLLQFISYTKRVNSPNTAKVDFHSDFVQITLSPHSKGGFSQRLHSDNPFSTQWDSGTLHTLSPMRRTALASFIYGTDMQPGYTSPLWRGATRNLWG